MAEPTIHSTEQKTVYQRVFAALFLGKKGVKALHKQTIQLINPASEKPVHWRNYHLTLVYIGNITQEQLNAAMAIIAVNREKAPHQLQVETIAAFPRPGSSILAAIIKDCPVLSTLQTALHRGLSQTVKELKQEKKKFRPHITLARGYRFQKHQSMSPCPGINIDITRLGLFYGVNSTQGYRYQSLFSVPLP